MTPLGVLQNQFPHAVDLLESKMSIPEKDLTPLYVGKFCYLGSDLIGDQKTLKFAFGSVPFFL